MIRAIVFDLDGVIIESAEIKTRAFEVLFAAFPDKLSQIMDYHNRNAGISRYVKFRYFYEKILGQELSVEKERELGERFSQIALQQIIAAPLVAGAEDFLKSHHESCLLFVASGTPEDELHHILERRGLDGYFRGAFGAPKTKSEICREIMAAYGLSGEEAVFIGDAESDRAAAAETGMAFIARIKDGSQSSLHDCRWRVQDLTGLAAVLEDISRHSGGTHGESGRVWGIGIRGQSCG